MTDPIADFLTRIRNGLHADHDDVDMPASKFKAELARILREQGYIEATRSSPPASADDAARPPQVHRGPQARDLGHASASPSRAGATTSPRARSPRSYGGMGTAIVSTSRGVMTGHDARRTGVGGELVAKVW